jgi:hypothetical protein
MGKTVKSPASAENATPKPHSNAGIDVTQSHRRITVKSSGDTVAGRPSYSSPTPDMKGKWFGHTPNKHGV